jgi:hypothetical protein
VLELRRVGKAKQRRVEALTDEDEALATRFEARLRKPFQDATDVLMRASSDWERHALVGPWNPWNAITALPWQAYEDELRQGIQDGLEAVFRRAMTRSLRELGLRVPRVRKADLVEPDMVDQLVFEYIQIHSAQLVTSVSEATKQGIRELLEAIVLENPTPAELARRLRENGLGLTPQWARAVERRRQALIASGAAQDRIDRETERYKRKLVNARARMIARTETIDARNAGTEASWDVAVNEGILDEGMLKIWIAKMPCPICIELSESGAVPMGEPFESPTIGPIQRPPAHPNCKCSVGLVDPGSLPESQMGPSARRMWEARNRADDEVRAVAQQIQAEIMAGQRRR